MKKAYVLIVIFMAFLILPSPTLNAQGISVNATGAAPAPSAGLDISFTNKGFLMPRLSKAQRDSINQPATSLIIFDTTTNCFEFYTGGFWQAMICSCLGPPPQPGNISGPVTYCVGQTGVTYSIAPVPTATSYVWYVPSDDTIVSGQGSTSITVNFGNSDSLISVYAINTCGNGARQTVEVTAVSSLPGMPGAISSPYSPYYSSTMAFSITPVTNTSYYNWSVFAGATLVAGQGSSSISVNFGETSGNICVSDSNACGSSAAQCSTINLSSSCPAHGTATFNYCGAIQTFVLPACVSSPLTIQVYGAQGGSSTGTYNNQGGLGGSATGTLAATGGETLYVLVGSQPTSNIGGFDGGGTGVGSFEEGGGGASDVRVGGTALTNRVIVAGGGGGTVYYWTSAGGSGGGATGGNGTSGNGANFCGLGATQSAGGAGDADYSEQVISEGTLGQGGPGGLENGDDAGGGGGYYGGGGGDAGGGGGGSGYIGGVAGGNMQNGVQSGNGQVVITW